jgi:hypothetical protein
MMQQQKTAQKILINTSHFVNNSMNTFRYYFPTSLRIKSESTYISVNKIAINNSSFNITESFKNNTFSITWVDNTTKTFTFADGYYSPQDMNAYIQAKMYINDWYVTNTSGEQVYFIDITTCPTQYACQIDIFAVPNRTDADEFGYTKPSGATWTFGNTYSLPTFLICEGLQKILGFNFQNGFGANSTLITISVNTQIYNGITNKKLLNTAIATQQVSGITAFIVI